MKSIKRKLLSLLLAMAMVCSLVPTALAEGDLTVSAVAKSGVSLTVTKGDSNGLNLGNSLDVTVKEGNTDVESPSITYELPQTGATGLSLANGVLTAGNDATAGKVAITVKATKDSKEGSTTVDVTVQNSTTPPAQKSVSITTKPTSMTIGTPATFTATITGGANTDTVTWSSNPTNAVSFNPSTPTSSGVSVSATIATSVAAGTSVKIIATITSATGTGSSAEASFTANAPAIPTGSITLSGNTLTVGGTGITATASIASNVNYHSVSWKASDGTKIVVPATGNPVTITGKAAGTSTVTASFLDAAGKVVGTATSGTITVEGASRYLSLTNISGFNTNSNTFTVVNGTARAAVVDPAFTSLTNPTGWSFQWSSSNTSVVSISNDNYYYGSSSVVLTAGITGSSTISVVVTPPSGSGNAYTLSQVVSVGYTHQINPVVTVSAYSSGYNMASVDDAGQKSVIDQINSQIPYGVAYYNYASVQFKDISVSGIGRLTADYNKQYFIGGVPTSGYGYNYGLLSDVDFIPNNTTSNTTGGFEFTLTTYNSYGTASTQTYTGLLTVKLTNTGTSVGDISYAANIGDTQYFNAADFENLYYDRTNGGSLSYVTFSTPSSGTGTLYADGGRLSSGTPCYVSPSSRQTALDSVYFTPSGTTATRAGTVRIGFTAYGTGGRYTGSRTITGTVVINYLNGNAKDITYTPVGGTINLKASDFTDKYREVVGSTAPTDLTIQFQDVPSNGSLSYKNSSNSSSSVSLRSSNIKSYRFTTRTSGANQIGDVTYTASGTRSDTISYIAYSGGTARFSGKVVFNPSTVSTTLTVTLVSSTSAGVDFNASSFTMANATVMASCAQIRFTVPTSGTLTYAGTAVGYAGVTVPVTALGQIHYKPNAGFNNSTDRVAFICYDAAGNQIGSGQVNIVVSGNNTSTPSTGGVTSIGGFTDLPKAGSGNDWYFTELSSLVSRGIVQGTGNGKAEPRGKLTYGQALKMILLAAKYPAQTEVPGNDWAINYKNLAVQNGLISSSVVLTDYITRDAVAELAAKALKVQPVTGNSPFKDSTNGYAIALNRTSPQILKGDADGNFRGSSTLIRSEAWVIIYRMYEYADNQSSTQMPDGI